MTIAGFYLVPVPIGNREDITLRALRVLSEADIIACEDSRSTGQLLQLYQITPARLLSYHDHNESERIELLMSSVRKGQVVALVSDAGTPLVSDPGYRLVRAAIEAGLPIVPLPGATAFVPALIASGFPADDFCFLGFAPHKKGRRAFLTKALAIPGTVVLYESPHRIAKVLREMCELGAGDRSICLCREISKIHEEFARMSIAAAAARYDEGLTARGEFVLVLGPA